MENLLEYYRPRGAQGNYKALLKLQYISSETVGVICYIKGGPSDPPRYGQSEPYSLVTVDAVVEGAIVTYPLPPLKVGDYIFIRIQDKDIALPQINFYEVGRKIIQLFVPSEVSSGFRFASEWYPLTEYERQHWASVKRTEFKPIELVDMDGKSKRWPKLF